MEEKDEERNDNKSNKKDRYADRNSDNIRKIRRTYIRKEKILDNLKGIRYDSKGAGKGGQFLWHLKAYPINYKIFLKT